MSYNNILYFFNKNIWLDLRKANKCILFRTIIWSIVSQVENRYLHAIHHNFIAIYCLTMHQPLNGWLAKLPAILEYLNGIANSTSTLIRVEAGSHKVAGKGYINTENSQMYQLVPFSALKQLNPWSNSPASRMVIYSRLPAFLGEAI